MPTPQTAIFGQPARHQWYVHLSRHGGYPVAGDLTPAALAGIRSALAQLRADCASYPSGPISLLVAFGPSLLAELAGVVPESSLPESFWPESFWPESFSPYTDVESADGSGRRAVATQEELMVWLTHPRTDAVWKAQYDFRTAVAPFLSVVRETPAFVFGESLDMTGFIDGIGNPAQDELAEVALVPPGSPAAGGSHVIAQRWVHDLDGWNKMAVGDQEAIIGRKKYPDNSVLAKQAPQSHLRHVELRADGNHGVGGSEERDKMFRRSAPYALHDGTLGLYFLGFCASQAPLRERMDLMYGLGAAGGMRDGLTDFSQPVSGSYYFAPSEEALVSICAG